jgi:hypothetical protein
MVLRLEALADAIISINGSRDPQSPGYQARNPLYLRDYHCRQQQLRHFAHYHSGYDAAIYDLQRKCSGRTRANLPTNTLAGLMRVYSMPDSAADYVARFLRTALDDPSIVSKTELEYFLR